MDGKKKTFIYGEQEVENNILKEMRMQNFKAKGSVAYAWFESIFGGRMAHNEIRSICLLFSELLGITFGREFYRRKQTCVFWAQLHLEEIKKYLSQHTLTVECTDNTSISLNAYFLRKDTQPLPEINLVLDKYSSSSQSSSA